MAWVTVANSVVAPSPPGGSPKAGNRVQEACGVNVRWKRLAFVVHRWIGLALGLLVFVWFASGLVMMYHRYPFLTPSRHLALLRGFTPESSLVGFAAAERALRESRASYAADATHEEHPATFARLRIWNGRPVYELWKDHGAYPEPLGLVDARNGSPLTPLSAEQAARAARAVVGPLPRIMQVDLLARSDHYFMGSERKPFFPVYRVRFDDADATAVYVSRDGGVTPAVITRLTRFTTWFGTVPHWLYFMWLYYDRPGLWLWISYVLPGIAVLLAITGIVFGIYQLWPRQRNGVRRVSPYRGVSRWHHVAGIVFGAAVVTWALSGLFRVLGESNVPRVHQPELAQGGEVRWTSIQVSEAEAWSALRAYVPGVVFPRAVDLEQFDGRPGYHFRLDDGRDYWVDAVSAEAREELSPPQLVAAARRVAATSAPIESIDRITEYETYYYARHGREMVLPAWRIQFDDHRRSTVYLDTVSGRVVGFVDNAARQWRWWRDAMHTMDFPWLNNRRPLWDLVVLPLMVGCTISAFTGAWLLVRRVRRLATSRKPLPGGG
jgi:hypothetical protein